MSMFGVVRLTNTYIHEGFHNYYISVVSVMRYVLCLTVILQ